MVANYRITCVWQIKDPNVNSGIVLEIRIPVISASVDRRIKKVVSRIPRMIKAHETQIAVFLNFKIVACYRHITFTGHDAQLRADRSNRNGIKAGNLEIETRSVCT